MTPLEIKKAWIAALRSGKYKQGQGQLRSNHNEFCCLGVLCDLASKQNLGGWGKNAFIVRGERDSLAAPKAVREWADISIFTAIEIDGRKCGFAIHNDEGKTFKQIADAIEQQLL